MKHHNQIRFARTRNPRNRIPTTPVPLIDAPAAPRFDGNSTLILSLTALAALTATLIRAH